MYILFNSLHSGLGNNGGSKTLLKCQENIEKLGYKCDIIAINDHFNWFHHKRPLPYFPYNGDAVIATACTTVDTTLSCNIKNKFWYIRGHETWVPGYNEERIIQLYKNDKLIKITNSVWIRDFIEKLGQKCYLVHQGIDFNQWEFTPKDINKNTIIIGCLYNKKVTKHWDHFCELAKNLGILEYEYCAYGTDNKPKFPFDLHYTKNPSIKDLNHIYQCCDYWFVPTELEGLHNVPLEAALCGCKLIVVDYPRNGVPYIDKNNAIIISKKDISQPHIKYIIDNDNSNFRIKNMINTIKDKIGNRIYNMKKFIEIITQESKK